MEPGQFGAVIVAAGLSSRMGAFKPLLPLGNSTIIERILGTLREAGVEDIAVVTGHNAEKIEQALGSCGFSFIHNGDYASTDMFRSASLGLDFMARRKRAVFFTPVDTPLFSPATVRLLAEHLQNTGTEDPGNSIVTPFFNGRPGHPVLIGSEAALKLIGHTGGGGLRGAIEAYGGPKKNIDSGDPGTVFDADTREDYKRLTMMDLNKPFS
ncbi:nucleotidyltransferase family protein [Treponema primitia]|uniref:nucleotidyltransferase family protein n=1 Tax=Treponema primitia TaxID=88058 RepID=UPI0002555716|nr:nucleotidyltransferase family protein [Treponema primitia]